MITFTSGLVYYFNYDGPHHYDEDPDYYRYEDPDHGCLLEDYDGLVTLVLSVLVILLYRMPMSCIMTCMARMTVGSIVCLVVKPV